MSAPGQAAAFAASRFRHRGEPRPWPEALQPIRSRFGADVEVMGGFSSETETRRGSDLLRRGSAVFFPPGRLPVNNRPVMFAHQVVYLGPDVEAFAAAVGGLPDPRRPLLPMLGVLR